MIARCRARTRCTSRSCRGLRLLIDAHAHVLPGSFPSAPSGCDPASWPAMSAVAGEDSRLLTSGALRFTARTAWFDAEQRLAASAASGVDAEVVSPFPPLLNYALAAGAGRDLARWVSEYIASLCAAFPGRFYGLGTVPLQDPALAAGELAAVAGLGLAGVEIASNVAGVSLADPRFLGFFAEAERLGMAVFVHAMPAPSDRLPGRPSWPAGSGMTPWCSTGAPSGTSSTCWARTGCWWGPTSRRCPGRSRAGGRCGQWGSARLSSRTSRGTTASGSSALTRKSYSRRVSSTVSSELADSAPPEPWTSPGAAAQRPPRLLLTLLGDYWWQRTEPLPSAAIVGLLAEFGVSDSAARAALSRLTRNGLLITSKTGRRTFSRLSSRAAGILDDGARRIFSFGAASQPWDGMWSLVAFSIPEDNRAARDALRKQLRWRGFAPLYDGLWVSPRDHAAEVIGYLKDLDITTGTAFRATSVPADCDIPARAWDLDGLRQRYECFISFAGQLRDAAVAGRVPPADALIARTRVMDEWRAFPALDPDLPAELLPGGWPRADARELFIGCYDLLGAPAALRVRQIITRYSPELADRAAYHSSELKLSAAPVAHT